MKQQEVMQKPRTLAEIVRAIREPVGHKDSDWLLIEALQSLIYYRSLNPQQRKEVQMIIDEYVAKSTVSPSDRSLYKIQGLFPLYDQGEEEPKPESAER